MAGDGLIPGVSSGPDAIKVGGRKLPIALVAVLVAVVGLVFLVRRRHAPSAVAPGYSPSGSEIQGLQDEITSLQQQIGGLQVSNGIQGAGSTQLPPAPAPAPATSPNDAAAAPTQQALAPPTAPRPAPTRPPLPAQSPTPASGVAPDMADRSAAQIHLSVAPPRPVVQRPLPRVGSRPSKPLPVLTPSGTEVVRRPGHPY